MQETRRIGKDTAARGLEGCGTNRCLPLLVWRARVSSVAGNVGSLTTRKVLTTLPTFIKVVVWVKYLILTSETTVRGSWQATGLD